MIDETILATELHQAYQEVINAADAVDAFVERWNAIEVESRWHEENATRRAERAWREAYDEQQRAVSRWHDANLALGRDPCDISDYATAH